MLSSIRRCDGMADVTDSKSVGSDTVWVRVPPPAPSKKGREMRPFLLFILNLSKTWQTSVSDVCHFICHFRKKFADFFSETPLVTHFFSQRISSSVAWTLPVQTDCSLCFPLRFAWLQHPDVRRCSPLWNSSSVPARSESP